MQLKSTLTDGIGTVANAKHGLAIHSPESNNKNMATYSVYWAVPWNTESIKIKQNQEKDFVNYIWRNPKANQEKIQPVKGVKGMV